MKSIRTTTLECVAYCSLRNNRQRERKRERRVSKIIQLPMAKMDRWFWHVDKVAPAAVVFFSFFFYYKDLSWEARNNFQSLSVVAYRGQKYRRRRRDMDQQDGVWVEEWVLKELSLPWTNYYYYYYSHLLLCAKDFPRASRARGGARSGC